MQYSTDQIRAAVIAKGYSWFDGQKDYNLNIVGVRNSEPGDNVTNVFDDLMTVSFRQNESFVSLQWPCTTDPGKKAMLEYHNVKGVARLVPGQYRGAYKIGLHKGQYTALVQVKPVSVYRDKDKDMEYDEAIIDVGLFGINIHRSNALTESTYVENWSEGCQVFKRVKDFNQFISLCKKAKSIYGESFTYTLIESKDIS